MNCWHPRCRSKTMHPADPRFCWIHFVHYRLADKPIPLSIVPLRQFLELRLDRIRREGGKLEDLAERYGTTRRNLERIRSGGINPCLGLVTAERWAARFRVHPDEIWGSVYWARASNPRMKVPA